MATERRAKELSTDFRQGGNKMEIRSPKVSIVLPTYNGARYLRQSIESCLNQTYKHIELIIVDDGSKDSTPEIVESYNDPRIKYIKHKKNRGLPNALNTGFANTTGEYLTWTSDDNLYLPQTIEKMVAFIEESKCSFIFCDYFAFYGDNMAAKELRLLPDQPLFEKGNCIGYCFLYT